MMRLPDEPRFEDQRLLTGNGRFTDDAPAAGMAHAFFVRSPHAFAALAAIDTAAAAAQPGVLAVLTGRDMTAAGIGNLTVPAPVPNGAGLVVPSRPALAVDCVRHVGEAVALVVAETESAARDAAELVAVPYSPRQAVSDVRHAAAPGAPQLWPEAPGNLALDWRGPGTDSANSAALDAVFKEAAHVARLALVNQRIVVAPLEPRAALAAYDLGSDRHTLTCGSQSAFVLHDHLCRAMGLAPERLRVLSGDVGGAFGIRIAPYPEYPALLVVARRIGRPVRWAASRSECFLSDNQARDTYVEAALALDAEGRFLGLKIDGLANMGAYLTSHAAFISTVNFTRCLPGMYHIPRLAVRLRCVFTNTVPTGPYRGAGRPEANYCLERLVDEAARTSGIDRIELRRRNLIAPSLMPYRTPVGTIYDSGDFPAVLDAALERGDAAGFPARRARSAAAGKRRASASRVFSKSPGASPAKAPRSPSPAPAGCCWRSACSRAARVITRSTGVWSPSSLGYRSSRSS